MDSITEAQSKILERARQAVLTWSSQGGSADVSPSNIGELSACRALVRRGCLIRGTGPHTYQITNVGVVTARRIRQQKRNAERARRSIRAA